MAKKGTEKGAERKGGAKASSAKTGAAKTGGAKTYLQDFERRDDLFLFDPEKLAIVEDVQHVLFDERVEKPLTEEFIRNIMVHGVKQAVNVRRNEACEVEVVDGRRRVRAAREANRRLRAAGEPPLLVRCVAEKGADEATLAGLVVSLNEQREDDDLVTKAVKIARLVNSERMTVEQAAVAAGKNAVTIKRWLEVAALPKKVHDAIRADKVPFTSAHKLRGLRGAELDEAMRELTAEGVKPTARNAERVAKKQAPQATESVPRRRPLAEVREMLGRLVGGVEARAESSEDSDANGSGAAKGSVLGLTPEQDLAAKVLRWTLGEIEADELAGVLPTPTEADEQQVGNTSDLAAMEQEVRA